MHLQMQHDVWLDNVINLRQYILQYTVGNPTSLCNVAFHWMTSEYMQVASWQPLDVKAQQSTFSLSFWRENVNSALEWG